MTHHTSYTLPAVHDRVIGYEPIPVFRAFFEFSAYFNDVMHLVDIRSQVVSHQHMRPDACNYACTLWGLERLLSKDLARAPLHGRCTT